MVGVCQMNKIQYVDPIEWVVQSSAEPWKEKFKTIHFDRFKDYQRDKMKGMSLLSYSCGLLKTASEHCSNFQDQNLKPLIYFPLNFSKTIKKWKEDYWDDLGNEREPPSLYILYTEHILDLCEEEYKCPVDIPIALDFPVTIIFRCSRDIKYMKNNWEFQLGIYLYKKGDF